MNQLTIKQSCIEMPRPNDAIYDACISITGSFTLTEQPPRTSLRVRALLDNDCIGETQLFCPLVSRHDVSTPKKENIWRYRLLARLPGGVATPCDALIELFACWEENGRQCKIGDVRVRLFPALLQERAYGDVVYPERQDILHRENIYGWGPPLEQPGDELLQLILDYLPVRSSVVDIGCGAGAYGPGVVAAGHRWLGLEINPYCWELLGRRQLPFRKVEEQTTFPCTPGEFDHAVCLEVLEHVEQPDNFLREVARIIRGRALFSVPNIEVIPYFRSWEVVPWHLLESDHKNFFTRGSLAKLLRRYFSRVEVFSCGEHPLRTREGIPLHVHLFAVADK